MIKDLLNDTTNPFSFLEKESGIQKENEIQDGRFYSVEFISNNFIIKLENYRREIYTTLYKRNSDKEIELFNLLSYLKKDNSNMPKSEYFKA